MSIQTLYIYILLTSTITIQDETTTNPSKVICKNDRNLISFTQEYKYVEVELNVSFILECHYCFQNISTFPKLWYKIRHFNDTPVEVDYGMDIDMKKNRIVQLVDQSLIVKNVVMDDVGVYYCYTDMEDIQENFKYAVDVISSNVTSEERGDLSAWYKYHELNLLPINNKFNNSNGTEFVYIRNVLQLHIEVITEWEDYWSSCDACGREKGKGIEEKMGYCRVKAIPANGKNKSEIHFEDGEHSNGTKQLQYFLNVTQLSCRSLLLEEIFPNVSQATRILPNFVQIRYCDGICIPDPEHGWVFGKSKGYKYRKIVTLLHNSHFTAVCPESTLSNKVIWRKNGKVLKQGSVTSNDKNEPHIIVDTFNTLFLIHVTVEDEGNYTCQVDDIRMQQIRIFVVSIAKLFTQVLIRHMLYLLIILSISSSCYCCGLVLACCKRKTFKQYEEVRNEIDEEEKYKSILYGEESVLNPKNVFKVQFIQK